MRNVWLTRRVTRRTETRKGWLTSFPVQVVDCTVLRHRGGPLFTRRLELILHLEKNTYRTLPTRFGQTSLTTTVWSFMYSWFRASSLCINKIKQDATDASIYLLQSYSTCFGCLSHPSSGVHQTVTAASGTGRCPDTMTCTRGCSYSLMYSWWWVP